MKTIFQKETIFQKGTKVFDQFRNELLFSFDNFQFIVGEAFHLQIAKNQNHYLSFYFEVEVVM